jgi:hypothetical protein
MVMTSGIRRQQGSIEAAMTIDNSIPQAHGKNLEVVEIDGPCGRFEVAPAGARPEGGGPATFIGTNVEGSFFMRSLLAGLRWVGK